jgi:hypothetical protein
VGITLDDRITGYLRSLAHECKSCRFKGASCDHCAINGAEGLCHDMETRTAPVFPERSEARKRKDEILGMLAHRPLTAREIELECSIGVKSETLNVMERDGEIEVVRRHGKQKLYMLPAWMKRQVAKLAATKTSKNQEASNTQPTGQQTGVAE